MCKLTYCIHVHTLDFIYSFMVYKSYRSFAKNTKMKQNVLEDNIYDNQAVLGNLRREKVSNVIN